MPVADVRHHVENNKQTNQKHMRQI